jgi:hypothetical protein
MFATGTSKCQKALDAGLLVSLSKKSEELQLVHNHVSNSSISDPGLT